MIEFDKAQRMHKAFSQLVSEFATEGKTELAETLTTSLLEVPDSSMTTLHDILQHGFFVDSLELGAHVNVSIDGQRYDAFIGKIDRDRGGFWVDVAKGGDEFDTMFVVEAEILPA